MDMGDRNSKAQLIVCPVSSDAIKYASDDPDDAAYLETAKVLIDFKADIFLKDQRNSMTALHYATSYTAGSLKPAQLLLGTCKDEEEVCRQRAVTLSHLDGGLRSRPKK